MWFAFAHTKAGKTHQWALYPQHPMKLNHRNNHDEYTCNSSISWNRLEAFNSDCQEEIVDDKDEEFMRKLVIDDNSQCCDVGCCIATLLYHASFIGGVLGRWFWGTWGINVRFSPGVLELHRFIPQMQIGLIPKDLCPVGNFYLLGVFLPWLHIHHLWESMWISFYFHAL